MLGTLGASANITDGSMYQAAVTVPSLNVRSASNASASFVRALKQGIIVNVYEKANGWCRVNPTEQHWVSGKSLRIL
jgi:SH3-like domain-containing protein